MGRTLDERLAPAGGTRPDGTAGGKGPFGDVSGKCLAVGGGDGDLDRHVGRKTTVSVQINTDSTK